MEGISLRPVYGKKTSSGSSSFGGITSFTPSYSLPPSTGLAAPIPKKVEEKEKESSSPKPQKLETVTDQSKRLYSLNFLSSLQQRYITPPANLEALFAEFPELKGQPKKQIQLDFTIDKKSNATTTNNKQLSVSKQGKPTGIQPGQKKKQGQQGNTKQAEQEPTSFGHRAANPWNPLFMDEKDQLVRHIIGTLNKLTPENFNRLSTKLAELFCHINDEKAFDESVALLYQKAIVEHSFSRMYSQLCVKLSETQLHEKLETTFRRVLLNKCQQEFEEATAEPTNLPVDPEARSLVTDLHRKRKIGNVKFIGELFKSKLLSEKIVHGCIHTLLQDILRLKTEKDKQEREFNAELLCKLLITIGKLLDSPNAKLYIDAYFAQITKFSVDSSFSSRIRFMFQDLLELRLSEWIPRREENTPKKISEVHADHMAKEAEDELAQISPRPSTNSAEKQTKSITQTTKAASIAKPKKSSSKKSVKEPTISSETELEDNLNSILAKYLRLQDLKEAVESFKELSTQTKHKLVELSVLFVIEKTEKERDMISKLFSTLHKESLLNDDSFVKGFQPLVDSLEDLKIDIPLVEKYLSRFMSNAIADHIVSASTIQSCFPAIKA